MVASTEHLVPTPEDWERVERLLESLRSDPPPTRPPLPKIRPDFDPEPWMARFERTLTSES